MLSLLWFKFKWLNCKKKATISILFVTLNFASLFWFFYVIWLSTFYTLFCSCMVFLFIRVRTWRYCCCCCHRCTKHIFLEKKCDVFFCLNFFFTHWWTQPYRTRKINSNKNRKSFHKPYFLLEFAFTMVTDAFTVAVCLGVLRNDMALMDMTCVAGYVKWRIHIYIIYHDEKLFIFKIWVLLGGLSRLMF